MMRCRMICGKCCVQFKDGRMGVIVKIVRTLKRAKGVEERVQFHHGDEFVCPTCGAVVVAHMGDGYETEARKPDFTIKA